jgi:RNA polymerase sigma-70 factor (ECF subfamily)
MSNEQREMLKELLSREHDFLRAHSVQLARKSEDAEDLYQETVMKAYRGFRTFQPETNFRAWIGRIMLNTHINNYNKKKNSGGISCDLSSGECDNTLYHGIDDQNNTFSESPEKIFFSTYINDDLVTAIYSLPEQYKTPFSMFHLEGYSYEEISKMTDVPIGTVKSRIFRARKMIRQNITKYDLN